MRPFQREHTFMARLTILLGIALIILGLGGYFGTGRESATALIPVLFGLPLLVVVPNWWIARAAPCTLQSRSACWVSSARSTACSSCRCF